MEIAYELPYETNKGQKDSTALKTNEEMQMKHEIFLSNISLVVRWWVLKIKIFGQKSICIPKGMILENKVVQKLKLEKKMFFTKNGLLN